MNWIKIKFWNVHLFRCFSPFSSHAPSLPPKNETLKTQTILQNRKPVVAANHNDGDGDTMAKNPPTDYDDDETDFLRSNKHKKYFNDFSPLANWVVVPLLMLTSAISFAALYSIIQMKLGIHFRPRIIFQSIPCCRYSQRIQLSEHSVHDADIDGRWNR